MNLLIFFIVSAVFIREAGIRVNRPAVMTAESLERNSVFVAISERNEIYVDRERVDLRNVIEKLRAQTPKAPVTVQADQSARAGLMIEAMDQIRLAGVQNVAVAATPKP